jgi:cytochrome b pre-mRNA-processing protein 3
MTDFGLPATFGTWSQVTMLHMWLLFARYRDLPPRPAREYQKLLVQHYFQDVEARMVSDHALTSRSIRHRYLKDLFVQWRGVIAAYDEGVLKGDAVLAAAIWRNVFAGKPDADPRHLAAVTSWTRRVFKDLDDLHDGDVLAMAVRLFDRSTPLDEMAVVAQNSESPAWTARLTEDAKPTQPVQAREADRKQETARI